MADTADTVAERTRRVVRASGLSQREFADRIGMDQTALSKALRGTRRLTDAELRQIARVGKVPHKYLTTAGQPTPPVLARAETHPARERAEAIDGDTRRQQIMEATARLIAARGLSNIRVADIAEACQTSPATLHHYFTTKDEALHAALSFYADQMHARLADEFTSAPTAVEKLRRLITAQLPTSQQDVEDWSVWVQSWTAALFEPAMRQSYAVAYNRWREIVLTLVKQCQAEGHAPGADPDALTDRFTALFDGLAVQVLTGAGRMTVERMHSLLLDAFEPDLPLRERN